MDVEVRVLSWALSSLCTGNLPVSELTAEMAVAAAEWWRPERPAGFVFALHRQTAGAGERLREQWQMPLFRLAALKGCLNLPPL